MVYCCGTPSCNGSALCEFPNGGIGQCDRADAGGIPPVIDGGAPAAACDVTSCTVGLGGNAFCKLACGSLGATCVDAGGNQHCMP